MKEFGALRFMDRFARAFESFGIDYKIMRRILQVKLTMDGRRVPTIMNNYKKEEDTSYFRKSLLTYGFMGIFIAIFMYMPLPLFFKMNIAFGMIIFMVMATMISDFSTVLLDIKDKNILLPRPINHRTVNAAKIIHIFIYLFTITLAIAGPALIAGTFRYGYKFFIIFSIELILISGLVIFFTSILYFLVLRFFDGEKLKDIINYFQIVLSIAMVIGYQLIGRVFDVANFNVVFNLKGWHYFIPSVWFAAPFTMILENKYEVYNITFTVLAFMVPVVAFIAYFKFVIPGFEGSLQKLNNQNERKSRTLELRRSIGRKLAAILCFSKQEDVFFRFSSNMFSKERKLKLRLYPSLAFAVVMPCILLFSMLRDAESFKDALIKITEGKYYLAIYVTVLMLSATINLISTSERYKGAWVYKVLPIEAPAPVFKGTIKVLILKYLLPVYLFVAAVFLVVYEFKILLDVILIFINLLITILVVFKVLKKELPFCKEFQSTQENGFVVLITSIASCGVLAGAHMFARTKAYGMVSAIIVEIIMLIILWRVSLNIKWRDIFDVSDKE